MFRQAKAVHDLTLRHNDLHFLRWRTVQVPNERRGYPGLAKAIEGLDALEADMVAEQRSQGEARFLTGLSSSLDEHSIEYRLIHRQTRRRLSAGFAWRYKTKFFGLQSDDKLLLGEKLQMTARNRSIRHQHS